MSKWQLPTQKGTELYPLTTVAPTAVRFIGVQPNSKQARELLEQYRSEISHFHRSQAQKYALSEVVNYRAHGSYGPLKLTYTNLQGQETIEIRLPGSDSSKQLKKPKGLYNCALLDLQITLAQHTYSDASINYAGAIVGARVLRGDKAFDYRIPNDARASSGGTRPVLQFAGSPARPTVGDGDALPFQVSSLLIDATDLPDPQLRVELYALSDGLPDDIVAAPTITGKQWVATLEHAEGFSVGFPYLTYRSSMTADEIADVVAGYGISYDTITPISASSMDANFLPGGYFGSVESFFSSTDISVAQVPGTNSYIGTFSWDGTSWSPSLSTLPSYPQIVSEVVAPTYFGSFGAGHYRRNFSTWGPYNMYLPNLGTPTTPPSGGVGDYDVAGWHIEYFFGPIYDYTPTPTPVSGNTVATLVGAGFKNMIDWVWSSRETTLGSVSFMQWEILRRYPSRPSLGQVATGVVISDTSTGPDEMDNLNYIGAITFDRVTGGLSFTPTG